MIKTKDNYNRIILASLVILLFLGCFLFLSPTTYSKYISSSTYNQSIESKDPKKPWEYSKLEFTSGQVYTVPYNSRLVSGKYYFTYNGTNYYIDTNENLGGSSTITLNTSTGKLIVVANPDTTGYTSIGYMAVSSGVGTISSTSTAVAAGEKCYFRTNDNKYVFFTAILAIEQGSKVIYNENTGLLYGPAYTFFAKSTKDLKSINGKKCLIGTKHTNGKWYFLYCNDSSNMTSYWYVSAAKPLESVLEKEASHYYLSTSSSTPVELALVSDDNYKMIVGNSGTYIWTNKNGANTSSGRLGRRRATNYAVFGMQYSSTTYSMVSGSEQWTYDPNTLRMRNSDGEYLYLDNIDSTEPVGKKTDNSFPWRTTWGLDASSISNLDIYVFYEQTGYFGSECTVKSQTTTTPTIFTRYPDIEK